MEQLSRSQPGYPAYFGPPSSNPDDFQALNQQRMQLMSLRVQRRKIQLLGEQLVTLQGMYVGKVEENIELKKENRRLSSLVELIEKEKEELLQELELLSEKHTNAVQEMNSMYNDNEHMQRIIEAMGEHQGFDVPTEKMRQLHFEIAELSNQLENRKSEPTELSNANAQLERQLKEERSVKRRLEEEVGILRRGLEDARQEADRLREQIRERERLVEELRTRQAAVKRQYDQSVQEMRVLQQPPPQSPTSKKQYIQRSKTNLSLLRQQQLQRIDEVVESHSLRSPKY